MQAQVVLIIDSRKEISLKYKKTIQQDCYVQAVISDNIQDSFEKIDEIEHDLVILSDFFEENTSDLIVNIRQKTKSYRPVLVIISKSDYKEDKLKAIRAGADDFISEPVDMAEFSAKIFAHLRRHVEELSNPISTLPSTNMIYKVINRTVKSQLNWALMYIDIDNLKPYAEIYGYIAADKVIKTFAAILKSSIDKGDFIGHIHEESFIVLADSQRADKIAVYLNYAFDSVSPRFYNSQDAKRGYLVMDGDEKAGIRIPLLSASIGIVSNMHRTFNSYQEVLAAAVNIQKLAKAQLGSSWVTDHPKISAEDSISAINTVKKKILIAESDAALAYLLTTTLEMQGYEAEAVSSSSELTEKININLPDLVLLDAGEKNPESELEICRQIKENNALARVKIIVSTIIHDKERVLDSGADLYLPKPYELLALFGWIKRFLD